MLGVVNRIGRPNDLNPILLSFPNLKQRDVMQTSQMIDVHLPVVLSLLDSSFSAQKTAFLTLAKNATGDGVDQDLASCLFAHKYLKEDVKDITALTDEQFETIIKNFMKEHDGLPSDTDLQTNLKGCIHQGYMKAIKQIENALEKGETELILSGLELIILPPEIGKCTMLTKLYLHRNQLAFLPPEIGNPFQLEVLALSENQLSSLPPEIKKLTVLRDLYLKDNKLPNSKTIRSPKEITAYLKDYFK